ncbi:hypothetical protein H6P81_002174 [Aristolochia fimbriata]|uniref:Gag-pol polyprotein n=1 Tax=Aristolochia fimbriata TaxID=158543 RepID=A0AAV7FCW7_ARIFI|nr:hypothetical protein H6P81_002174 [Aristolochia fimbriata]
MSAITTVKEAWESLEIHYEGTASVRIAKLQQLMTKFELIKIRDDETILDYDGKIRQLANEARLLGDPFPENSLVSKILRSLNKFFFVKNIVITEANNIDKMTLNEVIGSLCTFETEMEAEINVSSVNDQNIAFAGETGKKGQPSNENLDERIDDLSKGFNKLYRKFSKLGNSSKYGEKKHEKFTTEQRRVQCHGCDGYGHIQAACPTVQKKKKAHAITWSDSNNNSSDSDENYPVFYARVQDGVSTLEVKEDDTSLMKGVKDKLDNISIMNRELIVKLNESEASQKFLQLDVMKSDELLKLQEKQIEELQKELNSIKLILKNLEKGKGKLDEILSSGKPSCDKRGLGYGGSTPRTQTMFFKEGDLGMLSNITKHESGHVTFGDGAKGTIIGKVKHEDVKGQPDLQITRDRRCGDCQLGKQHKVQHKKVIQINIARPLEFLNADVIGPVQTPSCKGKKPRNQDIHDEDIYCTQTLGHTEEVSYANIVLDVVPGCVQGGVPDGVPNIDSEKDDRCFEFLEGTLSMCVV